jgi:hypothetical protein
VLPHDAPRAAKHTNVEKRARRELTADPSCWRRQVEPVGAYHDNTPQDTQVESRQSPVLIFGVRLVAAWCEGRVRPMGHRVPGTRAWLLLVAVGDAVSPGPG